MARPKRRRLTVIEHRALGALAKHLREHLMNLEADIDSISGRQAANHLRKATQSLNMFRTLMDSSFATDYPREFDPSVYYGRIDDEIDDETSAR
jgi:hypothetical protein